jgi:hypothetical protein
MVCLTTLNRSVLPLCWNFGGRTFECPFIWTFSPRASPVQASVSLPFASAESHARFSFGVKLNLTIFLLQSEIPSPLHFCGAPSIERTCALAIVDFLAARSLLLALSPFGLISSSTFSRRDRSFPTITPSLFLLQSTASSKHERNPRNELHPLRSRDGHGGTPFRLLLPQGRSINARPRARLRLSSRQKRP